MRNERELYKKARVLGAAIAISGAVVFGLNNRSQNENIITTNSKFVTIEDNSFVYDGKKFLPYGATFYPYWEHNGKQIRGSGWSDAEFQEYIDSIISMAELGHLNTLRPTNYFDGINSTNTPNWWENETVWKNMDYLTKTASDHNIFVLLDLSSFRDKLIKSGKYPYNPNDWNNFLSFVGKRYQNDPAILNYAIAGEVPCPTGKQALKPKSTNT